MKLVYVTIECVCHHSTPVLKVIAQYISTLGRRSHFTRCLQRLGKCLLHVPSIQFHHGIHTMNSYAQCPDNQPHIVFFNVSNILWKLMVMVNTGRISDISGAPLTLATFCQSAFGWQSSNLICQYAKANTSPRIYQWKPNLL